MYEDKLEVAQPATAQQAMPIAEWKPFDEQDQFWCSLQPKTDAERDMMFQMLEGEAERLKENANVEIALRHVMLHPVEMTTEQGEIVAGVRVVLLGDDGRTFQCVSEGIRRGLARLFRLYGLPHEWKEPKRFKVKLLTLTGGRNLLKLEPLSITTAKGKK